MDWFCCPRFDSPSVFASLLDADKGGHFRIAPDRDDYVSKQLYLPGTAILTTRFMTPDGVGEVQDFMPVITGDPTDRHRLVRNHAGAARHHALRTCDLQPRFDYGRQQHKLTVSEHGAVFEGDGGHLTAAHRRSARQQQWQFGHVEVRQMGDGLRATWTLREGDTAGRGPGVQWRRSRSQLPPAS